MTFIMTLWIFTWINDTIHAYKPYVSSTSILTYTPAGDYDSFAAAILSRNHRESISASKKVLIACMKGFT